jgi:hypothetical protein
MGLPGTAFKPFLETLAQWQSAVPAPAKPVQLSDLTEPKTLSTLQQHIVHEGGKYRVSDEHCGPGPMRRICSPPGSTN